MTNKEAYQLIESCLDYDKDMSENPKAYVEAIRLAKEVFDKQEPLDVEDEYEPYTSSNTDVYIRCPICRYYLAREYPTNQQNYCPECGQRLNWKGVLE